MPKNLAYLRLALLLAEKLKDDFSDEFAPEAVDKETIERISGELMSWEHQMDDAGSWLIQINDGVGQYQNIAHVYCTYADALAVTAALFPTIGDGYPVMTDKIRVEPVVSAFATFDEVRYK